MQHNVSSGLKHLITRQRRGVVVRREVVLGAVDLQNRGQPTPQKVCDESSSGDLDSGVLLEAVDSCSPEQPARSDLWHRVCAVADVAERLAKQPAAATWSGLEFGRKRVHRAHTALQGFGQDSLDAIELVEVKNVVGDASRYRREWHAPPPDRGRESGRTAYSDSPPALHAGGGRDEHQFCCRRPYRSQAERTECGGSGQGAASATVQCGGAQ